MSGDSSKRALLLAILVVLLGLAGFAGTRAFLGWQHERGKAGCAVPEIAWMRQELKLDEATFSQVEALHLAYKPVCAEMCARISASGQRLHALAGSSRAVTPDILAAMAEDEKVRSDCRLAMLKHLYATAAVMTPAQAERFLQLTLPPVSRPDHATIGDAVSHH